MPLEDKISLENFPPKINGDLKFVQVDVAGTHNLVFQDIDERGGVQNGEKFHADILRNFLTNKSIGFREVHPNDRYEGLIPEAQGDEYKLVGAGMVSGHLFPNPTEKVGRLSFVYSKPSKHYGINTNMEKLEPLKQQLSDWTILLTEKDIDEYIK